MIDSTLKVYQMFGDDYSKEIYGQRVLYSLTNDDKYIQKLVNNLEPIRWLRDKLKGISSPNVLLYGAGLRGKRLSWICPDLFRGFVDEDSEKHGKLINGLKVYSLHEAMQCFTDSVFAFMKWCNNHYKHIYCFEPDKKNYVLCRQNLSEAIQNICENSIELCQ